ncbi:MAG: hypothetical protein ACYTKD_00980 [Planctomycetota bacterium]|jgi:hypothetical protein
MPSAINYCERCGNLIPPSAEAGAVIRDGVTVCAGCLEAMSQEDRAAAEGTAIQSTPRAATGASAGAATGAATGTERRRTSRRQPPSEPPPETEAEADGRRQTIILSVALAGGIAIGVGVAAILASGGGPEPAATSPPPEATTAQDAAAVPSPGSAASGALEAPDAPDAPRVTPAARMRLQQIASLRNASLSRYAEMKKALGAFADEFPGAADREEAKRFEGEIDAAYAAMADQVLADAKAAATAMASEGRHAAGMAVIRSVASRFGDGDWLATKGQAVIDEALAELGSADDAETEKLLAKVRKAFETGGIDAARAAVRGRRNWPEERRKRAMALLNELRKRARESAATPGETAETGNDATAGAAGKAAEEAAEEATEEGVDASADASAEADPPSPTAAGAVTDGLVAHWPFDEAEGGKAADASGSGHEAKVVQGSGQWRPLAGKIHGAVHFPKMRGGKKIDCGKAPGSADKLTVAFWLKPEGMGHNRILWKRPDGTSRTGWGVALRKEWFLCCGSNDMTRGRTPCFRQSAHRFNFFQLLLPSRLTTADVITPAAPDGPGTPGGTLTSTTCRWRQACDSSTSGWRSTRARTAASRSPHRPPGTTASSARTASRRPVRVRSSRSGRASQTWKPLGRPPVAW